METWIDKLNDNPVDWLLNSNPWTKYKTGLDLLGFTISARESLEAKADLIKDQSILSLANDTKNWQLVAATRNNDPKISYFALKALAEFGLRYTDLGLDETVSKASEHLIENMFAVRGQPPEKPRKGEKYEKPDLAADVWHTSPCNSPLITTALLELGVENKYVDDSAKALQQKWKEKPGWFCHYFFVESQFKKLQVGCPIAGMQALEVFSKIPELKESDYARNAFEPIRFHNDYGKSLYYFGRSKKFWTLKYPFVWYNALYLADVLTRFDFLKNEPVVTELIDWIIKCQDHQGRFKPTSVFMHYKGWEFANKKEASPWITFLCCRILKQYFNDHG